MLALLADGDVADQRRGRRRGRALDGRHRRGARRAGCRRTRRGRGQRRLRRRVRRRRASASPPAVLDCGNSGTSMRLVRGHRRRASRWTRSSTATRRCGAGRWRGSSSRCGRWAPRLEGMATASGRRSIVTGRERLRAIDWETPVPSAQVKSAILLAGAAAEGTTRVRESVATRDHTERMLRARGVDVRSEATPDGGAVVEIDGGETVAARDEVVPGDPSAAAFWLVAGAIHPDADLRLRGVGVNPTRRAVIDLLRRMGAIDRRAAVAPATDDGAGEPVADLVGSIVRAPSDRARLPQTRRRDRRDPGPVPRGHAGARPDRDPRRGRAAAQGIGPDRRDRRRSAVRWVRESRSTGDDIVIEGPTRASRRGRRQPRRSSARAHVRDRGPASPRDARPSSTRTASSISYPTFFADLERIQS